MYTVLKIISSLFIFYFFIFQIKVRTEQHCLKNPSLNTFTNKSNKHRKYNNVNMKKKKMEAEVYTL